MQNRRGFGAGAGRCLITFGLALCALACGDGAPQEEMSIQGRAVPESVKVERSASQTRAVESLAANANTNANTHTNTRSPRRESRQILFGDLHVHTTFSFDAFLYALPATGGEGAHPPADACDFARYCANLDFFALTDHAESLRPEHWELSKQSIRECNERAGSSEDPDLIAFMGYEWSQAGQTPETHFGHRCLVFPETADELLPARPVASADRRMGFLATAERLTQAKWTDPLNWGMYTDYLDYASAMAAVPLCDEGVSSSDLPADCLEVAPTPAELHRKLDEWGGRVLEIPHGTAWGVYTPATTSIAKHLEPEYYDPERQRLIEIMSGHGNSEEYRRWREWDVGEGGEPICPAPSADYLPCCWQAGEIMRSRCDGLSEVECERRVELARSYATEAYTRPNQVFPDAAPEEWLDCGQCRDCFKPSFSFRPKESVQYGMSLAAETNGDDAARPTRFRYGFVASSDEHSGRPGVGYKAVDRRMMTDVNETPRLGLFSFMEGGSRLDPQMPVRPGASDIGLTGHDGRTQSFLYPGGLAAVHSASRSREDVWDAMQKREVYATSGPRILLWFDLLNGPGGEAKPMGSEVEMKTAPRFEVRAIGSFEPKPGCPDWSIEGLSAERIADLCHDECHFPSDVRRPIVAIEVVRITPQIDSAEDVDPLIEDPWRRYACESGSQGCVIQFSDEDFAERGRDALYYVRALEEARPAILGDPLRPVRNADGDVVSVSLCGPDDDCLDEVRERAWSSPIFVDHERNGERNQDREEGREKDPEKELTATPRVARR